MFLLLINKVDVFLFQIKYTELKILNNLMLFITVDKGVIIKYQ